MCEKIGFKVISVAALTNIIVMMKGGRLSLFDARVYLSVFEVIARREAAARIRRKLGKGTKQSIFTLAELAQLLREESTRKVGAAIRRLTDAGLISFSKNEILITAISLFPRDSLTLELAKRASLSRPVPIPRKLLIELCRESRKSLFLTKLAYILRGLSTDRRTKEQKSKGTIKASFISKHFGLSLRAVKLARAQLIDEAFIGRDTGSYQRKLNRDGSYFEINLSHYAGTVRPQTSRIISEIRSVPAESQQECAGTSVKPSEERRADSFSSKKRLVVHGNKIALPQPETTPIFAPPIGRPKTPYGSKNQKTSANVEKQAGVSTKREGDRVLLPPTLKNVQFEDLQQFSRTKELYWQAVKKNWLCDSEANFLNWVGAAVRAKTTNARDPVKVFVSIVRRGEFHFITQSQEERARTAIRRYRAQDASRVCVTA